MAFNLLELLLNFTCALMLLSALWVARAVKLNHSIIGMAFFSIFCTITYILLDAPDVSMTEAALGVCITTIIMLKVANNMSLRKEVEKNNKLLAFILSSLFAALLIYAGMDLPKFGDINSPVHSYVMDYYHENTYAEIGIPSFVAAILASYRGYDTFGETLVIYVAGICTIFILSFLEKEEEEEFEDNIIISSIAKISIPIIASFVLYIQINGTKSPGGGFQSGAILASLFIIMNLSLNYKIRRSILVKLSSLGICLYMFPGIIALLTGYEFLNYNSLRLGDISQKVGIEIVELGIAINVAATICILYQSFFTTKVTRIISSSNDS